MYTKEHKLQIIQLWYETKSPAIVRRRFNTLQDYNSQSDCAALTNLKIQRIVQHFQKRKTLHIVNKGRNGRQSAITPEKRKQFRKVSKQESEEILPNPFPKAGYVSNYNLGSHEKRPETVFISNFNAPCAAATEQKEEN